MAFPGSGSPPPNRGSDTEPSGPTQPTEDQARDSWSLRVATVSGIPIRLHFTFLLIITWLALSGVERGGAGVVLLVLGLFLCVALHELGHSLVAQRYGYKVRDIVLYPIGGVAAIEGTPRARHELWIALAGPAVNVVIAVLLFGYLSLTGGLEGATRTAAARDFTRADPLVVLMTANVSLVLFNMLPAFPMDGGRVLRAVLALKMGRRRATGIAASVGQVMAMVLGYAGLFGIPLGDVRIGPSFGLALIALFVFFAAGQEAQAERGREAVEGAAVGAAMVREFHTLEPGDSLRRAAEVLIATHQQDFPVTFGDDVVGVLSRAQLLRGLAEQGDTAYVSGVMARDVVFARPADPLEAMLTRADGVQRAPVLVLGDNGRLVGMLTAENLMEFLTLRQIARSRAEEQDAA